VRKLEIKNFQAISEATLTLGHFTLFKGESNQGKSSVRRALSSLLFASWKSSYLKLGTKTASITLDNISLTRSASKNIYEVEGVTLPKGGRGIPSKLLELGYKDKGLHIATQYSPLFMIGEDVSTVTKRINLITGLNLYEASSVIAKRNLLENSRKLDGVKKEIDVIHGRGEELSTLLEAVKHYELLQESIEAIENHLLVVKRHKKIVTLFESLNQVVTKMKSIKLVAKHLDAKSQLESLQSLEIKENVLKPLDHYQLLEDYLFNLTIKTRLEAMKLNIDTQPLEALNKYLTLATHKEELIDKLEGTTLELTQVYEELKTHTCPTCNQLIH
jgi:hypothetical protein